MFSYIYNLATLPSPLPASPNPVLRPELKLCQSAYWGTKAARNSRFPTHSRGHQHTIYQSLYTLILPQIPEDFYNYYYHHPLLNIIEEGMMMIIVRGPTICLSTD